MRFMVIVKATKESEAGGPPDPQIMEAMGKFNEELVKAGVNRVARGQGRPARTLNYGRKIPRFCTILEKPATAIVCEWNERVGEDSRGRRLDKIFPAHSGWHSILTGSEIFTKLVDSEPARAMYS